MNLDMIENEDGKDFYSENTNNIKINRPNAIGNAEFLKGTTLSPYSDNSLQLSSQSHFVPSVYKQRQSQLHDSYHFMLSDHLSPNENYCDGSETANDSCNLDLFKDVHWDVTTSNFGIIKTVFSYLIF